MLHVLMMDSFLNTLLAKVFGALHAVKLKLFVVILAVTQSVHFVNGFEFVSCHQFGLVMFCAARVTKK
jgi:hypothetical protein